MRQGYKEKNQKKEYGNSVDLYYQPTEEQPNEEKDNNTINSPGLFSGLFRSASENEEALKQQYDQEIKELHEKMKTNLTSYNTQIDRAQEIIDQQVRQIANLQTQICTLTNANTNMEETHKDAMTTQKNTYDQEIKNLTEKTAQQNIEKDTETKAEIAKKDDEIKNLKSIIQTQKENNQKLKEEKNLLQLEVPDQATFLARGKENSDLRTQNTTLTTEKTKLLEANRELTAKVESQETDLKVRTNEQKDLLEKRDNLENIRKIDLTKTYNRFATEIETYVIHKLEKRVTELKSEIIARGNSPFYNKKLAEKKIVDLNNTITASKTILADNKPSIEDFKHTKVDIFMKKLASAKLKIHDVVIENLLSENSTAIKSTDARIITMGKNIINFLGSMTVIPVMIGIAYSYREHGHGRNALFFGATTTQTIAQETADTLRKAITPVALGATL